MMSDPLRLVQLAHPVKGRVIALVDEPHLVIINGFSSLYQLANQHMDSDLAISSMIEHGLSKEKLAYEGIYQGKSDYTLLPCFDHPDDPLHCMLTGTGLTHKASAENRQKMHDAQQESQLTDSMKMYLWGLEGGHPPKGEIGVQPEWFYKGNGSILRAHGDILEIPPFGEDGGEEPEVAGIYLIDRNGKPWHIGLATANEFSDHVMERKNYLYLAPSKIRSCSIGPELVIGHDFKNISGKVSILRAGKTHWTSQIRTGEENMAHSLANLEYHHFKYPNHRIPGQVHIHFFGADAFSFGEGIKLELGDMMEVQWDGMGRALRNQLFVSIEDEKPINISRIR